jgi:hypothetical protein
MGTMGHAEEGGHREVRDSYGVALAALAVSVAVLIASGSTLSWAAALFAVGLQAVALALTMRVSGVSRRVFFGGSVALVVALALGAASAVSGGRIGSAVALGLWLLLVIVALLGIGRRLAQYRRVTLPLVLGLLCAYLLLGLAFGITYSISEILAQPAFSPSNIGISGAVYFSFVTLTTVGYGDIAAVNPSVRAIAVLEAILGQLYLVSVVSFAVGRLGSSRAEN